MQCLFLIGLAIWNGWIGMQTGTVLVAPAAMQWIPGGDDPAIFACVPADGIGAPEDLVVDGLLVKACGVFQHDAVLDTHVRQCRVRLVQQPELHSRAVFGGHDFRSKANAVGEVLLHLPIARWVLLPFSGCEVDCLLVPDCGDVRVRQVGQAKIGPDRFRDIRHDVRVFVPGGEQADFGVSQRINGSIQKADAGMSAAWIRQDQDAILWACLLIRAERLESLFGTLDLVRIDPQDRGHLVITVVMLRHVLQPEFQRRIIGCRSRLSVGWLCWRGVRLCPARLLGWEQKSKKRSQRND